MDNIAILPCRKALTIGYIQISIKFYVAEVLCDLTFSIDGGCHGRMDFPSDDDYMYVEQSKT